MRKLLPLIIFGLFIYFAQPATAFNPTAFVSFVNPVRGTEDEANPNLTRLDVPLFQYKIASQYNFPVTWLLRYDAIKDATMSSMFTTLVATDSSQTVGGFLEITPKLAESAGISYPPGETPLSPQRIFLTGYSQDERVRLIDKFMETFYDKFGYYPSSVGAWYIDSYSLEYLVKKYSVLTALLCDEQYSMDRYRMWGSYVGSPYIPSQLNSLLPAKSQKDRVNIAIVKWAVRDPFNFYGPHSESLYSFQVNDYLALGLNSNYFEKILALYSNREYNDVSHVVIGLENGYQLASYQEELINTYKIIDEFRSREEIKLIDLTGFGNFLLRMYPENSPAYFYKTNDPSGSNSGTSIWYQTPHYRIGLKSSDGNTQIVDLRLYHANEAEPYYLSPNTQGILYAETPALIDSVKYPGTALNLGENINFDQVNKAYNGWDYTVGDSSRSITFTPQGLVFKGIIPPELNTNEIIVTKIAKDISWSFSPRTPYTLSNVDSIISIGKLLILLAPVIYLFLRLSRKNRTIATIGLLSSFFPLTTMIMSGRAYYYGFGFWGPSGHDGIFHLSIMNSFRQSLSSFINPQFVGAKINNYHIAFDYIGGLVSRLFDLTSVDLYFRILPIIIALLLVVLLVKLLEKWRYSYSAKALAVSGVFLTGSLGFLVKLLGEGRLLSGESIFWANQAVSMFINPPFVSSVVILIAFLFLYKEDEKLGWKGLLLLSFLGGLLAQVKVYAFLLLGGSLLLTRQYRLLIGVGITGLLFLLPSLSNTGQFPFVFSPLWFIRTMVEAHDRLNWRQAAQAWQVYEAQGALFKLFTLNAVAALIFLLGNFGVRLFSLPVFFQNSQFVSEKLAKLITILGVIVPFIFVQAENPWNTIQFIYYSLFFSTIFAAYIIGNFLTRVRKPLIYFAVVISLALIALPTTFGTLLDYLSPLSASRISSNELRALDILRQQPRGTVMSMPFFSSMTSPRIVSPKPLYAYTSTAYISAMSGQPEYISDLINLSIMGYQYEARLKNVQRFFNTNDKTWAKQFLIDNNIRYVYETYLYPFKVSPGDICLTKIFDSGEINIYKLTCHGENISRN